MSGDRKAAKPPKMTSDEIYRFAFTGSTDAIIIFDELDGGLREANPAATAMYGYGHDELIRLRVDDLCASPSFEDAGIGDARLLHRHVRKDGRSFPVEVSIGSLLAGATPLKVMIVRDISECPRGDRELRKQKLKEHLHTNDRMNALGRLAGGVAHEIRNPLTWVIGNADYLATQMNGIRRRYAEDEALTALAPVINDIQTGAHRILRIVRDLAAFSQTETDAYRNVNVESIADSMINLARSEFQDRARLIRDFHATEPVYSTPAEIGQVVLHLLINAAQAMPEGDEESNEVCVRTRMRGDRVILEVSDTGCGIPAARLPHIFDPFFTSKNIAVSSGLGLAVCHGIVTGMGGEISVDSEVGRGSTFHVSLPSVGRR